MRRRVVDTNVPIVANGRLTTIGSRSASVDCREATVRFLQQIHRKGKILIDTEGEIQTEYRKHLHPSGQPGVGDRFYQDVLNSAPRLVERVDLPRDADGEYVDLPRALVDAGFDPSDRKFAALAKRQRVPVVNATDSDWLEHRATLLANDIEVEFLCGCDQSKWFRPRGVADR